LGRCCRKNGGILLTRNNRLIGVAFLNRTFAIDAHFESMLLGEPSKVFFRQHRRGCLPKSKRAMRIHTKVRNRRNDFLQKASAALAKECGIGTVVVGHVSAQNLSQTRMGTSVYDAGWSRFRDVLSWKMRLRSDGIFLEVCENWTSQTCSECSAMPASRPGGIAGLRIREWTCDDCGTVHDRDTNTARNILRLGLEALGEGA
jgi:putative transposase